MEENNVRHALHIFENFNDQRDVQAENVLQLIETSLSSDSEQNKDVCPDLNSFYKINQSALHSMWVKRAVSNC